MPRFVVLSALLSLLLPASAAALCPANVAVQQQLSCSSVFNGYLPSGGGDLGGLCSNSECYTCGSPFAPLSQAGPELVYSFECQVSGSVQLDITNMDCDLDIYILDDTCDPFGGCEAGSTANSVTNDSITFTCTAGQTYYIVVEGYGYTINGNSACNGNDGDFTLSFDLSNSTACNEDCGDGLDNDFDTDIDCADSDCAGDPLCGCDDDGDGYDDTGCGGADCDDTNAAINPGAPELCNGVDEDCDGSIDEDFDTDGDGYTTCDDD